MRFEIIGRLRDVETIARGVGIRDRKRLIRLYGSGKWRKLKGVATIRLEAQIHWYEAQAIGRNEIKFKRPFGS